MKGREIVLLASLVAAFAGCGDVKKVGSVEVKPGVFEQVSMTVPPKEPFVPWRLRFVSAGREAGEAIHSVIEVRAKNTGTAQVFLSPGKEKEAVAIPIGETRTIFEGTVEDLYALNSREMEMAFRTQGESRVELRFLPAREFAGSAVFDVELFRKK